MNEVTDRPLVELSREIQATPETVWDILTTPARFSEWMEGIVTFEPRVGSAFRAEFPAFQTVIAGDIVTLEEDERRLAVTWGVESGPQAESFPAGCSQVDFRVEATDSGCIVHLVHSRLPSEKEASDHAGGWQFHLSRMDVYANRADLGAGLERTLALWLEAWNEQDPEARRSALAGCCAEDVVFRDDWTSAAGIDLLNMHISNCFNFMPGWHLEYTDEFSICRGEALVGWRSSGPGGSETRGFNHVTADVDGRIRRVSGFALGAWSADGA